MLKRYVTNAHGEQKLLAKIHMPDEHRIPPDLIDPDAVRITRRLNREGYDAFIVGGAVRDLLVAKKPKDFDIATNAVPRTIRRLFRNSRIIGKRFKLVHTIVNNKVFEVSTFRSAADDDGNSFGAIEEDVRRRDYSINALYYCPHNRQILDFVDGVRDIKTKKLRALIPLEKIFTDDPVRIIRGVKYAITTGLSIEKQLRNTMSKEVGLLKNCSSSRLTEELFKILESRSSSKIFRALHQIHALEYILPFCAEKINSRRSIKKEFFRSLSSLDTRLAKEIPTDRGVYLFHLFRPFMKIMTNDDLDVLYLDIFTMCKQILKPLTPPNADVETATRELMTAFGIHIPDNKRLSVERSKRKALQKSAGPHTKNAYVTRRRMKSH